MTVSIFAVDEKLESLTKVGIYIKAIRQKRGLGQEEVAAACNCSAGHISRIEQGDTMPSLALLECIFTALRINIRLEGDV